MIGAICGDIVGSVYEFNNLKSKDFDLFAPDAAFTDDSVLTVPAMPSPLAEIRTRWLVLRVVLQKLFLKYL